MALALSLASFGKYSNEAYHELVLDYLKRRERDKPAILSLLSELGDPEFALKMSKHKERANQLAVSNGLPSVGSRMTSIGIEWMVDGHTFARSAGTLGRVTGVEDPRELYPVVIPQNVGPRLQRVLDQLYHCCLLIL